MLIVPAIDLLGGRCVRLYQGDYSQAETYDVDPVEVARGFVAAGARRIHLVDLDAPGVHRHALALVTGTAISTRTRGSSNAYEVLELDGAMVAGARITVRVRESTGAGWSEGRVSRFGFASDGVVAGGAPN